MRTIEYLFGPDRGLFLPAAAAGIAVALLCGPLSVFVVLRRLAFVGHGVSHAAFGGIGLAAVLGLTAPGAAASAGYFGVVSVFCLAAAALIAMAGPKGRGASRIGEWREDTLVGVTLVASLALGALLLHVRSRSGPIGASVETSLFGSVLGVRREDAALAWLVALGAGLTLVAMRRPLVFWAFDEPAADAFGVRCGRMRMLLMVLLGVAVVVSMKLAGVLLATALLVLPGAAAVRMSKRLGTVFVLAVGTALSGVLGGLAASFEADLPPGPCVVAVLVGLLAIAVVVGRAPSARAAG